LFGWNDVDNNWKNITNSQNSVRKKSFGGTFSFSNCHIIELDTGSLVFLVFDRVGRRGCGCTAAAVVIAIVDDRDTGCLHSNFIKIDGQRFDHVLTI
jgi:hypothetical protein